MKKMKKEARALQRREARQAVKSLADVMKKAGTAKKSQQKTSQSKQGAGGGSKGFKPSAAQAGTSQSRKRKSDSPVDGSHPTKKNFRQGRTKPNAELVEELKRFWNLAREKNVSKGDRDRSIASIVSKMRGNVLQVTLRHDASRAVQCILQFGTSNQRQQILNEMSERICEIAKTPYGHFVVLKALTYCGEDTERGLISSALRGHFVSLGTNVIGARTVESLLQQWPKKLTKSLKAEFYGHKFVATLPDPPSSLRSLMEALPAKRDALLDHMRDLVQRFVDKGLLEFSYVHNLIWEYVSECQGLNTRLHDLVNLLSDSALKLISTKAGAKAMCVIISNATAKDRKKIMKSLKGHVLESLLHDSAYLAIMRLVDVTDDTVNVQRMLLEEITATKPTIKYSATGDRIGVPYPPLIQIAKHQFGRKLLLRLLSPQKRHLEPDEESLFSLESIAPQTSKKDPSVRRHEHIVYLRSPLLQVVSRYLPYLITCPVGSMVLVEVVSNFFPVQVLNHVVDLFCGRYQAIEENDQEFPESHEEEEEVNDEEDEEDDDNEDEERGDDEDVEGQDEVEENNDDEEEYDAEDLAAAIQENLENYGNDAQTTSQNNSDAFALDLSALEENAIAQNVLKRVLEIQAGVERGESSIDQSLWERVDSEGEWFPFALNFTEAMFPADRCQELLSSWIQKNRPSFILSDILKVPSARSSLLTMLKPFKKQIKSSSKTLAGGKTLLAQMEGNVGS